MVAFVHNARFGRTGHFVFLYNGEEFVARLNRQPRTGTPAAFSVHSILPDRMSTGHLTRGAMSIIPPNLHCGDIGISVTPHTAGVQSTASTSTAQRSSINVGGGLFATPSESSHSRLDYHDSVAPHTAGAQLTTSTPTSQQPSTDTGGGSSATPSNNPTIATHSLLRGFVPPTASAPYTSSTQPLGGHPASDFDASGRTSSNDWTSNNPCPAIRPSPQPADTHPNDRPSSANRTTKPYQTARKAPSQAEASNDSAEAGASSSSAAPEWGTHLRETILAEAAPLRFPLPTPATGGAPPFSSLARLRTALAPAGAGISPSLATREAHGMTGFIRPPDSRPPHGSRPRLSTGSGQDGRQVSQSRNAAAYGGHRTSGLRHSLLAQATSGSDGADTSTRSATPRADTMGGPAGFPLLTPYQRHPAAPVAAGDRGPPRSATSQAQSMTASAGPGSSPDNAIVIDNRVTSTPATGGDGGGVSFPPVSDASQAQSLTASAKAGVPSLTVDPQVMSAAATNSGGVSSLSGAPQAASTIDAGSDSNEGPSRKKRKRSEKQLEDSHGRTKK